MGYNVEMDACVLGSSPEGPQPFSSEALGRNASPADALIT